MIKILEFLLESSPVAVLIGVIFYILNLKIKHLEDGQNDLKAEELSRKNKLNENNILKSFQKHLKLGSLVVLKENK